MGRGPTIINHADANKLYRKDNTYNNHKHTHTNTKQKLYRCLCTQTEYARAQNLSAIGGTVTPAGNNDDDSLLLRQTDRQEGS